jgi:hypothetical protein
MSCVSKPLEEPRQLLDEEWVAGSAGVDAAGRAVDELGYVRHVERT